MTAEEHWKSKLPAIRDEKQCWEWGGARNRQGYGSFCYENRSIGAHRAAWEIHVGPIPKGMCICHKCDNPPCVNPTHLFIGTLRDNVADRVAKGRTRAPKATDDEILSAMNKLIANGLVPTLRKIMREVGLTSTSGMSERLHGLAGRGLVKRLKTGFGYGFLPANMCLNKAHPE